MTTKDVSRLVVLACVVVCCVSILFKLITGAISLVSSVANLILGLVIVLALVLIVLWIMASAQDSSYVSVTVCFVAFFFHDVYGFISWQRMKRAPCM